MTKRAIITTALIAVMAAAAIVEYRINATQREENRGLCQRIAQSNTPEDANRQQVELEQTAVPSSADDQSAELVRLRAEIESLKKELAETRHKAERDQAALAQAQADQTAAQTVLKQTIKRTRECLGSWGYAWTACAGQNHGQLPTSFEQARPFLPEGVPMENDLVPSQFEIVYQGSLSNLGNPRQIVVLRQREAVQTPGQANWLRTYLFADGHVEIQSTPDGNFEAWESEHTAANP